MAIMLKTATGEFYFNPDTIARVHLSPDHQTLTVHFVNGTLFSAPVGTEHERQTVREFLATLSEEGSGFLPSGRELLNLRSAQWVSIPEEGPVQVRWQDNRTHVLSDINVDHVRATLRP
jgi:hypothetical protein